MGIKTGARSPKRSPDRAVARASRRASAYSAARQVRCGDRRFRRKTRRRWVKSGSESAAGVTGPKATEDNEGNTEKTAGTAVGGGGNESSGGEVADAGPGQVNDDGLHEERLDGGAANDDQIVGEEQNA